MYEAFSAILLLLLVAGMVVLSFGSLLASTTMHARRSAFFDRVLVSPAWKVLEVLMVPMAAGSVYLEVREGRWLRALVGGFVVGLLCWSWIRRLAAKNSMSTGSGGPS